MVVGGDLSLPTARGEKVAEVREIRRRRCMRYWTARTEAACTQRLVNEIADFSPGEEKSSEEAYNNPACLQGQVIPPPVLGFGLTAAQMSV